MKHFKTSMNEIVASIIKKEVLIDTENNFSVYMDHKDVVRFIHWLRQAHKQIKPKRKRNGKSNPRV